MDLRASGFDSFRARDSLRQAFVRVLLAALVLGLLASVQSYANRVLRDRPDPLLRVLTTVMPEWLMWALLVPPVWWYATRVRSLTRSWRNRALFHVAGALAFIFIHSLVVYGAQRLFRVTDVTVPLWQGALGVGYFRLVTDLVAYGSILALIGLSEGAQREATQAVALSRITQELAEAKLRALRMQLNPHFLFNALNTVSMMVRRQDGEQAVRVVSALSDLLRQVLNESSEETIGLGEEVRLIERYLAIERARFGAALCVIIDADPTALAARIPSMILLPLVENALRHGIARRPGAGRLVIRSRREQNSLVIDVTDDGAGLGQRDGTLVGHGIGLSSTVERLRALYGANFSFDLRDAEIGAVATLRLPYSADGAVAR